MAKDDIDSTSYPHSIIRTRGPWTIPLKDVFEMKLRLSISPRPTPPFALEKLVKLTGKIANSFWIEKTGRKLNWVVSKLCVYHQAFLYRPTDLSLPILLLFIFIFIFFIFFTIRVRI